MKQESIMKQEQAEVHATSGPLRIVIACSTWYVVNLCFNIATKDFLSQCPFVWTVTVMQLGTMFACTSVFWKLGLLPNALKGMDVAAMCDMLPAACCYAAASGFTSLATMCCSISFMQVIKATEPIYVLLWSVMLGGTVPAPSILLTLLPILVGSMLAAFGEIEFSNLGAVAAVVCTIMYAGRNVLSKNLMKTMLPQNINAVLALLAMIILLPVAAIVEGPTIVEIVRKRQVAEPVPLGWIVLWCAASCLCFFGTETLLFLVLSMMDVVSHTIANTGKRVASIVVCALYYSTPFSSLSLLGSSITVFFSCAYSVLNAKRADQSKICWEALSSECIADLNSPQDDIMTHNVAQA